MATTKKYTGLGRGLDALISTQEVKTEGSSSINEIPIGQITANPGQPRLEFDEDAIQDLASSIKAVGIIQPITLRQVSDSSYQIIAGERRYRAAQLAGLQTIPAYVRTADDENVMVMALIENLQRVDLNATEVALSYQHLIEKYGYTQEALSERVGKNRATVANYLRLLKLPAEIQMALKNKDIDMGHARALLAIDDPIKQIEIFREIRDNDYSVRKTEELVKNANIENDTKKDLRPKGRVSAKKCMDADYEILRQQLASFFQSNVQLSCNAHGKGKISIPFKNAQELERIISLLDKMKN